MILLLLLICVKSEICDGVDIEGCKTCSTEAQNKCQVCDESKGLAASPNANDRCDCENNQDTIVDGSCTSTLGECNPKINGCLGCLTDSPAKCEACNTTKGFAASPNTNCKCDYDCGIEHYQKCSSATECQTCEAGYETATCQKIQCPSKLNCGTCNSANSTKCLTCAEGYYPVNGGFDGLDALHRCSHHQKNEGDANVITSDLSNNILAISNTIGKEPNAENK